jgi:hypothetical protein
MNKHGTEESKQSVIYYGLTLARAYRNQFSPSFTKMRPSVVFFSLPALIPALVDAGMCAAWFDPGAVEGVEKCCTDLSGYWELVGDKEGACPFPNDHIDDWTTSAKPLMSNRTCPLYAWQCSPCGDVYTVTGGPTITAPATKTPEPSSFTLPPPTMYEPRESI